MALERASDFDDASLIGTAALNPQITFIETPNYVLAVATNDPDELKVMIAGPDV